MHCTCLSRTACDTTRIRRTKFLVFDENFVFELIRRRQIWVLGEVGFEKKVFHKLIAKYTLHKRLIQYAYS